MSNVVLWFCEMQKKGKSDVYLTFQNNVYNFFYAECPSGYLGDSCSEVCPSSHYGAGCRQKCNCTACHHIYGCIQTRTINGMLIKTNSFLYV